MTMTTITALNGRMPDNMLTVADTGANGSQRLRADAAASWRRMIAAGMPAGHLRSGYRTLAQQAAQDPKLAAPVGQSQHGEGIAVDEDEPGRSWIRNNGASYGWRIGFVKNETWHTEYNPNNDQHNKEINMSTETVAVDGAHVALGDVVVQAFYNAREANTKADKIIAALAKVSAPTTGGIDYAALAKAVNDDAAKRMQA